MRALHFSSGVGRLACLVILAVIVLVSCRSGPGVAAPTVKAGAPSLVNCAVGEGPKEYTLSGVFTGENLTFIATSSNTAVATASISGGVLTIAATGSGTATITVTATNVAGSEDHEITVTVAAPTTTSSRPTVKADAPASVEIAVGAEPKKYTLSGVFTGENLTFTATPSNTAVATASISGGVLTIAATGSGTATITVTATNVAGSATHQITVTVIASTTTSRPTVTRGATPAVDFATTTESVGYHLSGWFTGEGLTFTATPSNTAVATASISGGVLTIAATGPGTATITVTATNAGGNATHRITVTVAQSTTTTSEPSKDNNPSNCPSSLTIHRLVNDTKKCTLPMDHTMSSTVPDAELEVRESTDSADTGNVWLIIGKKKGTYTVTIFNAGVSAGAITVVVPNIPPKRDAAVMNPSNVTTETTLSAARPGPDGKTAADLDLETYFTDKDEGDTWRYRIKKGGKPDWVLINTKDGFIYDGTNFLRGPVDGGDDSRLNLEVLNEVEAEKHFTVSLYAVDDSGGESVRPVTLKFGPNPDGAVALSPRPVPYTGTQTKNGDLRAKNGDLTEAVLKVGPRRGAPHTLEFGNSFAFANSLDTTHSVTRLTPAFYYKKGSDYCKSDDESCAAPVKLPTTSTIAVADWVVGFSFFVVESSSPVVAKWHRGNMVGDPKLEFKLEERGTSGSITIKYYVVPATPADATVAATSARSDSKNLRINVVTCSSPPDPIKDCP